jgi:predicted HD phosphohydrolase
VQALIDFEGNRIRLTDERLAHVLEHPEMRGMGAAIRDTLRQPAAVIQSMSNPQSRLYYRYHVGTKVGDKYVCVVVKFGARDAFVLTAYLTDKQKRGDVIWPRKS